MARARPESERPTLLPEEPAAERNHLHALTGVRILAALAVYVSHVPEPGSVPRRLAFFFESGYMGVTFFFVLSGFVLAINYADRVQTYRWRVFRPFAVARVARVYPLYLLLLIFAFASLKSRGASTAGWLEHVLVLQAWSPSLSTTWGFNPPAWSISVEFFLYACFPALALLLSRLRTLRSITAAAAVIVIAMFALATWFHFWRGNIPVTSAGSAHRWLYLMPLTRVGDFALGILAARAYVLLRRDRRAVRAGGWIAGVAALAIVGLMSWPRHFFTAYSWDVSYAVPSALVIVGLAVAPLSLGARFLSTPTMRLLGEASYAVYLIHFILAPVLGSGLWALSPTKTTALLSAYTLGFILCMAVGLHILFERPARSLIRRHLGGAPRARPKSGRSAAAVERR